MKHTFVHILCKKVTVLMLGVGLGTTLSAQLPYQNPDLTPEQRATDLLQRLTVEAVSYTHLTLPTILLV